MRPFFDYMSDVLTTDINGVVIWLHHEQYPDKTW
jgi:hypothetical protein